MRENIQCFIIKGLFENKSYFRNVLNNLKPEYFDEDKAPLLTVLKKYYSKYEKIPHYSTAINVISNSSKYSDQLKQDLNNAVDYIKSMEFNPNTEASWLFDQTKEFADNRAFYDVIKKGAIELKKDDGSDFRGIQEEMRKALSMNWNEDLGLDYFDEMMFDETYDILSDQGLKIPIGIDVIDNAIGGGIPGKTKFLVILAGAAGTGKSLFLSNMAINAVCAGKNVLYITFEIDQNRIRQRIDAVFADVNIYNTLKMRDYVKQKIKQAKVDGSVGRFFIKEFPPASISALDAEAYINNLKMKKDFTPDIIILDYLGIMIPISKGANNSYERGKQVCEEIRALSDRIKCPILSATQTNRASVNAESVEIDNIADSMGIAHTGDLIISLSQGEELKENNKMKFQIIKSRISKTGTTGIVDIDYDKLKVLGNGAADRRSVTSILDESVKAVENKTTSKNITGIT